MASKLLPPGLWASRSLVLTMHHPPLVHQHRVKHELYHTLDKCFWTTEREDLCPSETSRSWVKRAIPSQFSPEAGQPQWGHSDSCLKAFLPGKKRQSQNSLPRTPHHQLHVNLYVLTSFFLFSVFSFLCLLVSNKVKRHLRLTLC